MRKFLAALLIIAVVVAGTVAWLVLGGATSFNEPRKFLYVHTGEATEEAVMKTLERENLLAQPAVFKLLANQLDVWQKLQPGRYEITKGENLLNISRTLRNHRQTPVNLVINKLRTNQDVARIIGKNFETDSVDVMRFINNADSLNKLGIDKNNLMTLIIPDTYSLYWNTSAGRIFSRLKSEQESFWNKNNRQQKAEDLGFSPEQVYVISSIVEEETNRNDEKGKIASVYINRYRASMPLGADPTIKFALQDFSLKRIYNKHLNVESPYNTYRHTGLPPGPICTPSPKTIDAVLNAPKTDYMFFVAAKDFSGHHTFSTTYAEHLRNAKEYQRALDTLILKKQKAAISQP